MIYYDGDFFVRNQSFQFLCQSGRKSRVQSISLKGLMTVESRFGSIAVKRTLSPSPTLPAMVEEYVLTNLGDRTVSVSIEPTEYRITETTCAACYQQNFISKN